MKAILSIVIGTSLCMACSKPTETASVQDINQQFISAWNTKDSDKLVSFLADDVQFAQGDAHLSGKSEVAQKWVRETLPTIKNLKTSTVSSGTADQLAYEAGTFSVDVLHDEANLPTGFGEGNFMFLWKKGADNTWKLSYAQLEDLPVRVKN